jgi:hypothetical protein
MYNTVSLLYYMQGGLRMPPDDLEARRWLRELFRKLGEQYPDLKTPEQQGRLEAELHKQAEEDTSHDES